MYTGEATVATPTPSPPMNRAIMKVYLPTASAAPMHEME